MTGGRHSRLRLTIGPVVVDAALTLLTLVVAYGSLVGRISEAGFADDLLVVYRAADSRGGVLVLVGTLPLLWRRRAPLAVFTGTGAAFLVYEALRYAPPPLPFAPLVALYTVAAYSAFAASAVCLGGLLLGMTTAAVSQTGLFSDDKFLAYFISVMAAWMLGNGLQHSRARTVQAEAAAEQLARDEAARTQLAVRQEQQRIARELHDIVAHNVCLIVAQAAAARRVWSTQPEQAGQALGSIEGIGREAMTEMRLLLYVLGADRGRGERGPQPRLDRLPALVAQIERAGLPVRLTVSGMPRPLPAAVELNVYRIVQEALTNSLRHAGAAARAEVVLRYRPDALEVRVADSGRGDSTGVVPGQGLVGMWQRATLLGGTLTAGPRSEGGFLVTVELPVNGTAEPSVPRDARSPVNGERPWVSAS